MPKFHDNDVAGLRYYAADRDALMGWRAFLVEVLGVELSFPRERLDGTWTADARPTRSEEYADLEEMLTRDSFREDADGQPCVWAGLVLRKFIRARSRRDVPDPGPTPTTGGSGHASDADRTGRGEETRRAGEEVPGQAGRPVEEAGGLPAGTPPDGPAG